MSSDGGEGGIRTHVPVSRQIAFEAIPVRPLRYLSALVGPRVSQELRSISQPLTACHRPATRAVPTSSIRLMFEKSAAYRGPHVCQHHRTRILAEMPALQRNRDPGPRRITNTDDNRARRSMPGVRDRVDDGR